MKRPVPWLAGVSLLTAFTAFSCSHTEGPTGRLPAVLWLVDHLVATGHETSAMYREPVSALPSKPVTKANAHQSGAVMVSLWPYAVQSARGDRASCEQFNGIFDRLISQPEYWRYDVANPATFISVGHWVPQFMWMGILLEQGLI